VVIWAEAEVGNVRAMARFDLVEAYDEALLVMARRETAPTAAGQRLSVADRLSRPARAAWSVLDAGRC
jgi:hypothetical protein